MCHGLHGKQTIAGQTLGTDRVGRSLFHVACADEFSSQAKIAVRCESEDTMMGLAAVAKSLNLCAKIVQDA
jgi:peptidyl-tRNA hydrolase